MIMYIYATLIILAILIITQQYGTEDGIIGTRKVISILA